MAKKRQTREEANKKEGKPYLVNFVYGSIAVFILLMGAFLIFRIYSQKGVRKEVEKVTDESKKIDGVINNLGELNKNNPEEKTYVVQSGDNLWVISEKFYNSGYNWVDIAKNNNIQNPSIITAGTKLTIPDISPKLATATDASVIGTSTEAQKIQEDTYTIKKGDSLWTIAESVYGNGFKWTDIAKANNLANPSLIHSDNVLKIPR